MDFEDFEFKPLTEGLGFHKKDPSTAKKTGTISVDKKPLDSKLEFGSNLNLSHSLPKTLSFDTPKFEDPYARPPHMDLVSGEESKESAFDLPELAPEINIFSKPLPREKEDMSEKKALDIPVASIPKYNPRIGRPLQTSSFISDSELLAEPIAAGVEVGKVSVNKVDTSKDVQYVEVAPSALSMFLDATMVAGLAILFTLGLVVATSLDMVPILRSAMDDLGTQIGIVLLVYSVAQLYLILSRSFFGQTLGEWSMDVQLGLLEEQNRVSYFFKMISRALVLTLTGFILLPFISMILGKDLAGRLAGLKLYTK